MDIGSLELIVAIDGQQRPNRQRRLRRPVCLRGGFVCHRLSGRAAFYRRRPSDSAVGLRDGAAEFRALGALLPHCVTLSYVDRRQPALTVLVVAAGPGGGAQHRAECGGWANRQNHLGCISVCA